MLTPNNEELKELRSMKKLLVLLALRSGASPEDIDKATGMGAGNIRGLFPGSRKKTAGKAAGPVTPIEVSS